MAIIGLLFNLVAFVCSIIILIHAFKNHGVVQGLLCLCVPFYILYYAFTKFEHEKKNLIVWGLIGSIVLSIAFTVLGAGMGG